jgi:hypothetical protein
MPLIASGVDARSESSCECTVGMSLFARNHHYIATYLEILDPLNFVA